MSKQQIRAMVGAFIGGAVLAEVFVVLIFLSAAPWHVRLAASGLVSPALGIMAAIVTATFFGDEEPAAPSAPSERRPVEVGMRR